LTDSLDNSVTQCSSRANSGASIESQVRS
jgi:hypothetical protein